MSYWERLLAHRHWISLNIFGRELHVCARCSGVILGGLGSQIFFITFASSGDISVSFHIGFIVALFLALPAIIDWTTQKMGFRESNNGLRLTTGLLEGIGLTFLNLTDIQSPLKLLIVAAIGLSIMSVGFLGGKRVKKMSRNESCSCA